MEILDTVRDLGLDPEDCVIRDGYVVDVHGSVCISNQGLDCFPIKFGVIYGDFDCSYNKLINLVNGPETVHGAYNCSVNKMTSLAGAPVEVRDFDCSYNFLTDLKYAPRVKSRFFCGYNKLVSLTGGPAYAHEFAAHRNQLSNLVGPRPVTGYSTFLKIRSSRGSDPLRMLPGRSDCEHLECGPRTPGTGDCGAVRSWQRVVRCLRASQKVSCAPR